MNKWTVYLEQEGEDLMIPLPEDMLQQLGWKEGDTIKWTVNEETGQIILSKKEVWYKHLWSKLWKK